jgi:hypothetical protein
VAYGLLLVAPTLRNAAASASQRTGLDHGVVVTDAQVGRSGLVCATAARCAEADLTA